MTLTFADLSTLLGQLWWPFFRILSAFLSMPFFGDALIPVWVRSLLAFAIALICAPLIPAMPTVDLFSLSSLYFAFEQALWGMLFGLILHILFNIFTMLGQIVSMQMGLSMAIMNDPVNGLSVAVLGRIMLLYTTLLFLGFEGHLLIIDIVVQSFTLWPVGSGISQFSLNTTISLFAWLFSAALALALPAVISMLFANISFGVMNRAAPSLNVYALGFPMTMLLGLFSFFLSMTGVPDSYLRLVHECLAYLHQFILGKA